MATLHWSVCGQESAVTQPLINRFKEKLGRQLEVEVISIPWNEYKHELTQIAIYRNGSLDISQIGAPVVNDLLAMNALRAFSPREFAELGGEAAFSPLAWRASTRMVDGKVHAIPLFADPRAIIYWSDLLEKAGVDENNAFSSIENMENTLQRLQASGIHTPWMLNVRDRFLCLHSACSWLWATGSDFVSTVDHKSQFTSPAAISGLKAYFGLKRYMHPDVGVMAWGDLIELFTQRRAAAAITNLGAANNWYNNAPAELRPYLRIATPPGPAFVGGSSLVIWKDTRLGDMAFNLLKFLISAEVQSSYPLQFGQLPARQDILQQLTLSGGHIYTGFSKALETGKIFPNIKLGGLLEEQLVGAIDRVWTTLFSEPGADIENTLLRVLTPLARRYDMMMS